MSDGHARVRVRSGPADPELPFRYGCNCGAIWNASAPIPSNRKALCGPRCVPRLFSLDAPSDPSNAPVSGDQPDGTPS